MTFSQSFKYLHNKPISELATSARFLHYLEAEKDLLVSIHLFLRQDLIDRLENGIISAFSSDEEGQVASAWNKFREQNIKIAVRNELIPLGQRWVKEWLRDEVEDFVANGCGAELEKVRCRSFPSASRPVVHSTLTAFLNPLQTSGCQPEPFPTQGVREGHVALRHGRLPRPRRL